ncbi:heme NO-binding domain-containing protein [Hymenobacter sp. B81]|uniref:heme NO-binding domain-containing protein n=1 Tax=Hymenobacter sp. B81 TaxID=3344878 RepID=UPI0037DCF678
MHGSIFLLLKRYVQTTYDHSTWLKLLDVSGLSGQDFDHKEVYPDAHIYALVGSAARMTGIPAETLQEKFGEYLVPDLMHMYAKLVEPGWRTLEMIEHTERVMHKRVREEHAENAPPVLDVRRLGPNELLIDYVSGRRMSALAVGIVRGLATYFDEAEQITVEPTTREDGRHVQIRVTRRT